MKQFKRFKTPKELKKKCKEAGFFFNDLKYRKEASDFVSFKFVYGKVVMRVAYNTVNGRAFGEVEGVKGVDWFSTDDTAHDRKHWFRAFLNFIYE